MISTTERAADVFVQGAHVVCKGPVEGSGGRFEGLVAASHEDVIHLNLGGHLNAEALVGLGQVISIQVAADFGWFVASARRIQNVVDGGMTLRLLGGPSRLERREYLRVRSQLPVRWKRIQLDQIDAHARDLSAGLGGRSTAEATPLTRDIDNPALVRVLKALNQRLDAVERRLTQIDEGGRAEHSDTVMDISGVGLRLVTAATLNPGDVIQATFGLGEPGQRDITLMARVVRVDPPNMGRTTPAVACHFIVIDDRDRELIIRFSFREHRRQLRESVA